MNAIVRHFLILSSLLFNSVWAEATSAIDWQSAQQLYLQKCSTCHGIDGNTITPTFPKLASQSTRYLNKQLNDYQQNKRFDPIMTPIAKQLSASDIQNLLAYIASFKANNGAADPKLLMRGEQLFRAGDLSKQLPACAACHGPEGLGNNEASIPALAGQNNLYLIAQLQAFKEQKRSNDPKQMMTIVTSKLSDADIQAIASFLNGLRPLNS